MAHLDPQILTGIQLFADLGPKVLAELATLARRQRFEARQYLFRAGEPRTSLLYLSAGRVSVSDPAADAFGDQPLSYGPGDVLGEGVLIEGSRHTVDALASEACELWAFEREQLVQFFATRAEERALVLRAALQLLTRRLEQLSQQRFPELAQYSTGRTRLEHDLLGDREVPRDAYWGVQTARAVENFAVTGRVLSDYPELIRALAVVKQAAARANRECGVLPSHIAEAIELACVELRLGRLHSQFVVDPIQGGAGTSTNMNANEVIANRALLHLGRQKGEYDYCHPNNHVNRSQSTNDVYPTALKLAMVDANQRLLGELDLLVAAFKAKGVEFAPILKMGRTQLQDAVPMTLGQEFEAYARSIAQESEALEHAEGRLLAVNMGGTAIGTGLTAPPGYAQRCVDHLAELFGRQVRLAPDLIEATQDTQAFVLYSSSLKSLAIKLSKIASDLRLLSSGPRAGLSEIFLPPMQPGSSIMPGKVNPVIPELVNQVAYKVIGHDLTVTMAAEAGQLQLNVMEPVIADAILESVSSLSAAARTFRLRCVTGIQANAARCREYVERSIGVVTALVPILGYEVSTRLAARALAENRGIVELVREEGLLSEERIAHLLSPERMVREDSGT